MSTRRLIAPLTERWNEGEQDWFYVKDPSEDIARWEGSTGHSLPDAYRRFMLAFNGGCVYPRLFR
ncbi:SMI1/KNR4 family protein [Microvirga sp. BT688]|uniref:SMI1/KNR4 family protein n=1 Tax=Microvirga sp. TaxID=1873136 RepID=UPI0016869EFE|nr:SMI1/KNR4 family protein [Microvirga sp.]MBD2748177.1 SMI1/KNR4 family protein [Microvirga sp.]